MTYLQTRGTIDRVEMVLCGVDANGEVMPAVVDSSGNLSMKASPPDFSIAAHLGAPVVLNDARIVAAVDLANGALTIAAQPDTPRNLTAILADANSSVTAATLTLACVDPMGNGFTEVVTYADLVAGWVSTKITAQVVSATVSGVAGTVGTGADQIRVGVGNVIGLPSSIASASAVKHVYLGGTRVASPTIATGTGTSGVNVSASTYNGTKQLIVYYNPYQ